MARRDRVPVLLELREEVEELKALLRPLPLRRSQAYSIAANASQGRSIRKQMGAVIGWTEGGL